MFCSPCSVASWPVVGTFFAGVFKVFKPEITELATPSFGVTTALMFVCAVCCCWKIVNAFWLSQVPAGWPTFVYAPDLNFGSSTDRYPWRNKVALLSVGSPLITRTCGFWTFQAAMQSTSP